MTGFLLQPGRPGAFGALLDECARAAEDFVRVAESLDAAVYIEERPCPDFGTISPHIVCQHVVYAAWYYGEDIRRARGFEHATPPGQIPTRDALRQGLVDSLRYTEAAIDGLFEADNAAIRALEFRVSWGVLYDPEMLLEHAIVHLLRHRRQLERW